jgi:D-mannonate dehydratase
MICYNFMVGLGWTRTNEKVPYRGGSITSEFDLKTFQERPAGYNVIESRLFYRYNWTFAKVQFL